MVGQQGNGFAMGILRVSGNNFWGESVFFQ
jgi:hypothetical protein